MRHFVQDHTMPLRSWRKSLFTERAVAPNGSGCLGPFWKREMDSGSGCEALLCVELSWVLTRTFSPLMSSCSLAANCWSHRSHRWVLSFMGCSLSICCLQGILLRARGEGRVTGGRVPGPHSAGTYTVHPWSNIMIVSRLPIKILSSNPFKNALLG